MNRRFGSLFVARLILGGTLIYAGLFRIFNPELLEKALRTLSFFPSSILGPIVRIFPWMLLFLGVFLISGYLAKYVAVMISALLVVF